MFDFSGLPDSINEAFLQRELIINGAVGWTEFNGKLYALRGAYGGEPDMYYLPTQFIIANPVLGSKTIDIDRNGIVMFGSTSDRFAPYTRGERGKKSILWSVRGSVLYNYIERTAKILQDIDVSAASLLRTTRAMIIVSAKDEQKRAAAEITLKRIFDGEPATVFQSDILDSIKFDFAPIASNAAALIRELAEKYQFYLAEFYHAIGINSNYNLKRERLNTAEVELNDEPLLINIADMLDCRREAVAKINEMFGVNISVKLSEEWDREKKGGGDNADANDAETVERENREPTDDNSGNSERPAKLDTD